MSELFEAMAMNIIVYASMTVTLPQMYELSHMMWSIATPTSLIAYTCILSLSLSLRACTHNAVDFGFPGKSCALSRDQTHTLSPSTGSAKVMMSRAM